MRLAAMRLARKGQRSNFPEKVGALELSSRRRMAESGRSRREEEELRGKEVVLGLLELLSSASRGMRATNTSCSGVV